MHFLHTLKKGLIIFKRVLIKLGDFMGRIMTVVLLSLLYVTVVAFVWLVSKIFRKKFLDLRFNPRVKSYWIDVEDEFNNHTLEKWELPY